MKLILSSTWLTLKTAQLVFLQVFANTSYKIFSSEVTKSAHKTTDVQYCFSRLKVPN